MTRKLFLKSLLYTLGIVAFFVVTVALSSWLWAIATAYPGQAATFVSLAFLLCVAFWLGWGLAKGAPDVD